MYDVTINWKNHDVLLLMRKHSKPQQAKLCLKKYKLRVHRNNLGNVFSFSRFDYYPTVATVQFLL